MDDRTRWNQRYEGFDAPLSPSDFVIDALPLLPTTGRALDVGGGAGANAVALAEHGLDVTVVDVSDVGLGLAEELARARGIDITTVERDLRVEELPGADWDVLCCVNFLDQSLFGSFASVMADGGWLLASMATVTNLERNERPSRRFLLEPGELRRMAEQIGLEIVSYDEGWRDDRHSARLVARR